MARKQLTSSFKTGSIAYEGVTTENVPIMFYLSESNVLILEKHFGWPTFVEPQQLNLIN
jgi:hypothetical protein